LKLRFCGRPLVAKQGRVVIKQGRVVMKKLLICTTALSSLAVASAFAADMPVKAPILKAAPMVDPWVGPYVGVNIGYSWGPWNSDSNQSVFDFESTHASPKVNGILGGLQAGYNFRLAPQWIWGIEGDIQITGEKAHQDWTDPGLPVPPGEIIVGAFVPRVGGPAALHSDWKFPWFGTLRLRAGFNPTPDWLLYATGGLAVGESKYSFSFSQPGAAAIPAPTAYSLSSSKTQVGYALGGGAEVKLNRNWSIKAEYLYVDLGKHTITAPDIDGDPFTVSFRVRDHIARLGLNYAFGP
jgi:opacity protein-like surface antigen